LPRIIDTTDNLIHVGFIDSSIVAAAGLNSLLSRIGDIQRGWIQENLERKKEGERKRERERERFQIS